MIQEQNLGQGLSGIDGLPQEVQCSFDDINVKKYLEKVSPELWGNAHSLEPLERWVLDSHKHQDFLDYLNKIAESLQKLQGMPNILIEESQYPNIAFLLAYVPITKALKLLSLCSQVQPGIVGDLAFFCHSHAQENEAENSLFIKRLRLVVHLECYRRVFNRERRKKILNILDQ